MQFGLGVLRGVGRDARLWGGGALVPFGRAIGGSAGTTRSGGVLCGRDWGAGGLPTGGALGGVVGTARVCVGGERVGAVVRIWARAAVGLCFGVCLVFARAGERQQIGGGAAESTDEPDDHETVEPGECVPGVAAFAGEQRDDDRASGCFGGAESLKPINRNEGQGDHFLRG